MGAPPRRGRAVAALAVIAITVILAWAQAGQTRAPGHEGEYCAIDAALARRFLESQYVDCARLLRAATSAYPDNTTIYVANDNLLASRALEWLGSPLAEIVREELEKYGGGWNGKVDVLLGMPIEGRFYASVQVRLGEACGYRILTEAMDRDRPIEDWKEYADLLVYHALNSLISGDVRRAEEDYRALLEMWSGYGFLDKPARESGIYEVYKCALYVYLYRALESAGSGAIRGVGGYVLEECLRTLEYAQAPNGGLRTHYRIVGGMLEVTGDTNVETTSMAVLALCTGLPENVGGG